jgi:tetratricopeptide (TPR) repeat protein
VEEGKGQWEKATRYYTKAIQTAPDFAPGYLNRANVDVVFGRLEEALAGYNSAIRVSSRPGASYDGLPDRWLYYLNRGTTRLALNRDPQKSVDDFDKAAVLRQRPEVLIAQNRAQAYERLGKYNLALGDYSNAVALRSRDVQPFWLRYAAVLYQNERDASALEVLRRVKSSFSGEAEVNAALAAVLAGMGNQEAALEAYRSLPALQRQKYADPEFLQKVVRWPPRLQEAALTLRKMDAERAGNFQKASGVDWGSGASSK